MQSDVGPLRDELAPPDPRASSKVKWTPDRIRERVVALGRSFKRIMDAEEVRYQDRSAAEGAAQQIVEADNLNPNTTNEQGEQGEQGEQNVQMNKSENTALYEIKNGRKKEGTINEFFQTFNTLHDKGAQIVISSDRPPNELNEFEDRLKSRFSWGLTTDITAPNYEDRMAILLNKVDEMDLQVPSETLSYIAGRIDSNVRDLEGALKNLKFYANTYHIDTIDIDTAAKALSNLESTKITQDKDISSQKIQEEVANFYKISVADMVSKKRPKEIAYPRQIAMYLIREITGKSLPAIGKEFGGRDHTTVIYAHKQISDKMKTDTSLQKEMDTIKSHLK